MIIKQKEANPEKGMSTNMCNKIDKLKDIM